MTRAVLAAWLIPWPAMVAAGAEGEPPGTLTQVLVKCLLAVLTAALPVVTAVVTQLVRTRVRNELVQGALVQLAEHAKTAVLHQAQTVIDPARKSAADGAPVGQIATATAARAKDAAVSYVREMLAPQAVRALGGNAKVERAVDAAVEAAVAAAKRMKNA